MDLGTLLSIAQTLFAALQCSELKDFCSILGYKSELEKLERIVKIVKAVLEEAESKEELPPQAQLYIDELKDAIYDADDLLDEFVTLAHKRKDLIKEGKISEKFWFLFSCFNPLATAHKMSQGVKEIRKRLDDIANEHGKFGFKLDSKPVPRRREETCSYVDTKGIIGREEDVEQIVRRLLVPDVHQDVSCLAIVGLGGLGKTALTQLVFNDPRIIKHFDVQAWTCVSDQDQKTLDVKGVLCKIFHSLVGGNHLNLAMETLQKQLRDQLAGKKWLIVLDDVWSKDRRKLLDLASYLMNGLKGSWIIVTTRSEETATVLGNEPIHKLNGLSEKDSWNLFEMTAFGGDKQQNNPDLIEISEQIVQRCAYVPLAIKVVGSLLYGQSKERWISFQKKELGRLKYGDNDGIEPILKFSYHQLEPPLKTCFSYCALFPKDHVIGKDMLLNLWVAQDYVVREQGQSIQDACEEYFSILVRRCFLQDITRDAYGEIISCKIHDLMHDIALEVAGKEVSTTNSFTTNLDAEIRHMSYNSIGEEIQYSFTPSKIRTCLRIDLAFRQQCVPVGRLLKNWTRLRVLDLRNSGIKRLPSALGKQLHLRYLDLSWNGGLRRLPNSITKLHNLQILNIRRCHRLKELPKDLSKLVKLRVLDIDSFGSKLNCMPTGMGKLSCLQKLPLFVVADDNSTFKQSIVDQMEGLKSLTSLRGSLTIKIIKNTEQVVENAGERGYIRNMECLSYVRFELCGKWAGGLLEDLKPHPNLRTLVVEGYRGSRMSSWAIEDNLATFLPNLVSLCFRSCRQLQHLPSLRRMCHLKFLGLSELDELEYIENTSGVNVGDTVGTSALSIFLPSLEKLELASLPNLKGCYSSSDDGCYGLPSFPRLSKLEIKSCPKLECIPPCPTVEELELTGEFNDNLRIKFTTASGNSKLRCLETNNLQSLRSILSTETFQVLKKLRLHKDDKVELLSEVEEILQCFSYSLQEFEIVGCSKLKSVSRGLEHLTTLERLELRDLPRLNLRKGDGHEDMDDGMPWRCLGHSLRSLTLWSLSEVVKLPNGMRHLTALQSLTIGWCMSVQSVPEWMLELTSLKTLQILHCSDSLQQRCRNLTGKDWPYIRHIPNFVMRPGF